MVLGCLAENAREVCPGYLDVISSGPAEADGTDPVSCWCY
jgi:hypothetical protein